MPAIWKTQQWPQDWKRSVFIPIPKKGNDKECSNYCTVALISHASKVMFKILQARLHQYMNCELPDVQAGFGDDGDLIQGILTVKRRQDGLGHHTLMNTLQHLIPERFVHEQPDNPGIEVERTAVGMIGGEEYPPRITNQEEELQSDGPLQGVHIVIFSIGVRDDTAPRLDLDVLVVPFILAELVQPVLPRAVRRDGGGVAEDNLADVRRDIGMGVDILRNLDRL